MLNRRFRYSLHWVVATLFQIQCSLSRKTTTVDDKRLSKNRLLLDLNLVWSERWQTLSRTDQFVWICPLVQDLGNLFVAHILGIHLCYWNMLMTRSKTLAPGFGESPILKQANARQLLLIGLVSWNMCALWRFEYMRKLCYFLFA